MNARAARSDSAPADIVYATPYLSALEPHRTYPLHAVEREEAVAPEAVKVATSVVVDPEPCFQQIETIFDVWLRHRLFAVSTKTFPRAHSMRDFAYEHILKNLRRSHRDMAAELRESWLSSGKNAVYVARATMEAQEIEPFQSWPHGYSFSINLQTAQRLAHERAREEVERAFDTAWDHIEWMMFRESNPPPLPVDVAPSVD